MEKEENCPRVSTRKEITKGRAYINEIKTRKNNKERSMKLTAGF